MHWQATLNPPETEWSPLPTMYRGNEGRDVAAPLMALKPITPWTQALLFHGQWFKVGDWKMFISVAFGSGVGFSTLYLNGYQASIAKCELEFEASQTQANV